MTREQQILGARNCVSTAAAILEDLYRDEGQRLHEIKHNPLRVDEVDAAQVEYDKLTLLMVYIDSAHNNLKRMAKDFKVE